MTAGAAIAVGEPRAFRRPARADITPIIGLFREARRDPLHFFIEASEGHGIVEFPNPLGRFFLVRDPDLIGHILRDNYRNYPKSAYYQRVRGLFGDGLFELNGEAWRHKRQTMQPAFHKERVEALGSVMVEEINTLLNGWEGAARTRTPIDIVQPLMQMTFQIITRALCGARAPAGVDALTTALTVILAEGERLLWALMPALYRLPSPRRMRLKGALRVFDSAIHQLIAEAHKPENDGVNLLQMLLASTNPETGKPLSPRELRDDMMTMLAAGHETTALAIAWVCYLLSKNPTVLRTLKAENTRVLGGRAPAISDLAAMPYNLMVIQETLRLFPPFWTLSRQALQDDALGGYHIPAGSTLMVCPYVTHRDSRLWENPEGFDPERFAPGTEAARHPFAYFPFGGGPRVCIGKNFALLEAQLCLAMIAQRFTLELMPGHRTEPRPMISLRPSNGIKMLVRPANA